MSTIREIVEEVGSGHLSDGAENRLIEALEAREQEKVDALNQVALMHGVMPAILAKVLVDLGLGIRTPEEVEFVNAQFEAFKADLITRYSEATGIPADLLQFPGTTPPEVNEDDLPGGGS